MHRTSLRFHLTAGSLAPLPFLSPVEMLKPATLSAGRGAGICRAQVNQARRPPRHSVAAAAWFQHTARERAYVGLLGVNILEDTQPGSWGDQVHTLPAKGWCVGSLVSRGRSNSLPTNPTGAWYSPTFLLKMCHHSEKNTNIYYKGEKKPKGSPSLAAVGEPPSRTPPREVNVLQR